MQRPESLEAGAWQRRQEGRGQTTAGCRWKEDFAEGQPDNKAYLKARSSSDERFASRTLFGVFGEPEKKFGELSSFL